MSELYAASVRDSSVQRRSSLARTLCTLRTLAFEEIAESSLTLLLQGSFNRTVTVVGTAAMQNEYVDRDVLGSLKKREYKKMGMRHFQDDKKHSSGRSCLASMLSTIDQ